MKKNITVVLFVLAAGCTTGPLAPTMDPTRKVSEQDCSGPINTGGGNLMCREVTEAELRARAAEEERQARAKREAEERAAREKREAAERAERERLERERAEQLAREEAARKAKLAEEERLAAERRRLEEEAARKAKEEADRAAAAAAALLAKQRAEQEAREKAARECRRLEQEMHAGRAILENFVTTYGKDAEFKGISGQIAKFLSQPRKAKPCPPE